MADINKILNKKGWTGKELGILELTNMAVQFQQSLAGEEQKPIVSNEKIKEMLGKLKNRNEGLMYNNYISIHDWLSVQYNISQTQQQQAQLQYRILYGMYIQAFLSEEAFNYREELPAIMTQKQYEDLKAEGMESFFTDDNGEDLGYNVFSLLDTAISYFLRELEQEPGKANPLKAVKKKYEKEPVKSKLILERWNELQGEGYYTLPDGRRSDQMSEEEWQEALTTPKMKELIAEQEATDGYGTALEDEIVHSRLMARSKVLFSGGTKEEADEAQERDDIEKGYTVPCEWHTYTEPPTDLTKWDVVGADCLGDFYPAPIDGEDAYTEENFTASMEDLLQEFPELVNAMLKEIDKRFSLGLSSLPVKEWETTVYSVRELYQMDFFGVRKEAEGDSSVFSGNYRALINGVAIVRPSTALNISQSRGDNGYYQEPSLDKIMEPFSLMAYSPESNYYIESVEGMERAKRILLDSFYFLTGYNYAVDQTAIIHDVPDITVFKIDLSFIKKDMDYLNDAISLLYERVYGSHSNDKLKKLQVLRDTFQPIDYESFTIPESNKERARKIIEDFSAFKSENADSLYNLLFIRPATPIEEIWDEE